MTTTQRKAMKNKGKCPLAPQQSTGNKLGLSVVGLGEG